MTVQMGQKARILAAVTLVVLVLATAACTPAGGANMPETGGNTAEPTSGLPFGTEETPGIQGVGGSADLTAELVNAGFTVEQGGEVEEPFFGNSTQTLIVNGETIQVFEFTDEASREAAAQTISANGYIIGTVAVDWISQPYFWSSGQVIALYVGTDENIINQMTMIMGDPLTRPQPAPTETP